MTLRPCIECGEPADGPRCDEHVRPSSPKGSAASRGYDGPWAKLSAKARKLQPFCSDCGATTDLQCDHSETAWERKAAGKSIRLQDVDVVCGPCNRRRGAARPANDPSAPANSRSSAPRGIPPARGHRDPRGKAKSELHTGSGSILDALANPLANAVAA